MTVTTVELDDSTIVSELTFRSVTESAKDDFSRTESLSSSLEQTSKQKKKKKKHKKKEPKKKELVISETVNTDTASSERSASSEIRCLSPKYKLSPTVKSPSRMTPRGRTFVKSKKTAELSKDRRSILKKSLGNFGIDSDED